VREGTVNSEAGKLRGGGLRLISPRCLREPYGLPSIRIVLRYIIKNQQLAAAADAVSGFRVVIRMIDDQSRERVNQFIIEQIDSVPHLEALLLIWNRRPRAWTAANMAKAIYVPAEDAAKILQELTQRGLILATPAAGAEEYYRYESPSDDTDILLRDLDLIYRRELVRVAGMIHSKASAAVRDFARAFRFKKDRE
jgi:hypothetical protein